ncbi:hypothetical protein RD792_004386 [Penstemon davidsonii]|uniref:Uncharacterized protein n=1 Tax=Penstemon davidsonii TaxID=160366 RepID=A0ABR0DHC0_9LAMI|nr:hypothetical protein RD792_004386 [Penstemon davidsonii]
MVEEVRRLFDNTEDKLLLVDTIQRLALDHHFETEIAAVLRQLHDVVSNNDTFNGSDYELYGVSLRFRLLRQEGYHISQDVFTCFMNSKVEFKNINGDDTKGLLALYEASHVGLDAEEILDEAESFSRHFLCGKLPQIDADQAKVVKYTLQNPHHKSMGRHMANEFLENLDCENEVEISLVRDLAKMELTIVGILYQEEVVEVVKWWNGLGLAKELKSARNQPMKWHMWSMAVLLHPKLSYQRILLTKPISLVYIVDDIFDLYATIDYLTLFTQAVKRWEISETEELPNYMKICFKAIQETTQEISHMVFKEHGWNPLVCLKKMWGNLCDAFLIEARWFSCGHLAKANEYLKNGILSSGVPMVLAQLFFIMCSSSSSIETEQLFDDTKSISHSVAMILRLLDDLGSAKDEHQDGYDGSYIECYMEEFHVSSHKVAREHVMNMISNTWKKLNKQCLSSNTLPQSFTKACLNAARLVPIMYNYDENHSLPLLEECIESMIC